ncbi:AbrB/MazE/SpoVT family DNA-binding domain-containing protein [Duganella sp. PWIR1]
MTLPKKLRAALGLTAGSSLALSLLDDGTVIMRVKSRSLSSLGGLLKGDGLPMVSIEDMRR